MSLNDSNYLKNLFIDEAMKALQVSRGGSSSSDDETQTYILVDEAGNEVTAVMVEEETVFTATANDIREGTVAATETGVTVGTKEIPAYITNEGVVYIPSGYAFTIPLPGDKCEYTELQALICKFNTSIDNSVSTDRVSIKNNVYSVNSIETVATVTSELDNKVVNLGIVNDSSTPYVLRYFTYKEEL